MPNTKRFLHVGCGPQYKNNTTPAFASEDWQEVRLDIDESVNPDIISSALDLSMIDSESFDAIYSSHNIEHVYAHEVPIMLKEFLRVLNADGYLVVACPNIIPVARLIVEDKLTEPAYISAVGPISPHDMLYGHGAAIEQGNEFMAHKTAFTPKSLTSALTGAGFKTVGMLAQDLKQTTTENSSVFNMWAIASKKELDNKEKVVEIMKLHLPIKDERTT